MLQQPGIGIHAARKVSRSDHGVFTVQSRATRCGRHLFYLGIAFDKLDQVENAISHYQRFLALDQGKSDKQSFQARERIKVLEKRKKKR